MKKGAGTSFKHLRKQIKKIDKYGVPIGLTYQGETEYKTIAGGLLTIFSRFALIGFCVFQMSLIGSKQRYVYRKSIYKNL
jgi:hypothetical protein